MRVVLDKSEQMARVRSRNTDPELNLRHALWRLGLRYRLHPRLPGSPDLCLPRFRAVVFVDGCFWHGCQEHYVAPRRNADFWRQKLERNQERDRRVDAELGELGWYVIRVWEHEITRSPIQAAQRVADALVRRDDEGA